MQNSQDSNAATFTWVWENQRFSMPVGKEDILQLARAVEHEGYPEVGVAWALIQRTAWLWSHGMRFNLGRLVTAYAQPINPLWFPGGKKHDEEMARLSKLGDAAGQLNESSRALARVSKAATPWGEISSKTKKVIADILNNLSTSPVLGAVHYWKSHGMTFAENQAARPTLVLMDKGYGFGPGRNVFFAESKSGGFGGISVLNGSKAWPGETQNVAGVGDAGKIVLAAALGYFAWRYFL